MGGICDYISSMNPILSLLPYPNGIQLLSCCVEPSPPSLILSLGAKTCAVPCPECGTVSGRVHSRYVRTLADLPFGDHAVIHLLHVRRFFCESESCSRRTFSEQMLGAVAPWARRTVRSTKRLTDIEMALGGNAGARLAAKLGSKVSRNTVLRLVRRAPRPSPQQPSMLGVDDWALRKRHHYGTVLVDLERRRPLALLADRSAGPLTVWLREHPGVAVIARDRSGPYARGAREGAPEAVQVADRFHLLQNLAEALEAALTVHARTLRTVAVEVGEAPGVVSIPAREPTTGRSGVSGETAWQRRLAIYEQVWTLREAGVSSEEIAGRLRISRATVFRHLAREAPPERARRTDAGRSTVDRWSDKVLAHWEAGRRGGRRLYRELQSDGYTGSYASLARYMKRLRQAVGGTPRPRSPGGTTKIVRQRPATPRTIAWTILRGNKREAGDVGGLLERLRRHSAPLREVIETAEGFIALIRARSASQLDDWLRRAQDGHSPALRRFAEKLLSYYDAVRAAVSYSWSTGPVEGQINRLKLLKRQMYGRAKLDLLEQKFLLAV